MREHTGFALVPDYRGATLSVSLPSITPGTGTLTYVCDSRKGLAATCGLQFLSAAVALVLTVSSIPKNRSTRAKQGYFVPKAYYIWENRRRDQIYGKPDPDAAVDVSELADEVRSNYRVDSTHPDGLPLIFFAGTLFPLHSLKSTATATVL